MFPGGDTVGDAAEIPAILRRNTRRATATPMASSAGRHRHFAEGSARRRGKRRHGARNPSMINLEGETQHMPG
jgi:hypothetical protein